MNIMISWIIIFKLKKKNEGIHYLSISAAFDDGASLDHFESSALELLTGGNSVKAADWKKTNKTLNDKLAYSNYERNIKAHRIILSPSHFEKSRSGPVKAGG